jgi:hypothetical protein
MGGEGSTHDSWEMCTLFLLGNVKGRDFLEDIGVDGDIILEFILRNSVERFWLDFSGSGYGPVAGLVNMVQNHRVP